jgi:hypothetical protein
MPLLDANIVSTSQPSSNASSSVALTQSTTNPQPAVVATPPKQTPTPAPVPVPLPVPTPAPISESSSGLNLGMLQGFLSGMGLPTEVEQGQEGKMYFWVEKDNQYSLTLLVPFVVLLRARFE